MKPRYIGLLAAFLLPLLEAGAAHSTTLTFDTIDHGEIVTDQFADPFGVSIRAVNVGRGPDLAIGFDSLKTGTRDSDLEGPTWAGGNLAPDTVLRTLLIIAENGIKDDDGLIDNPDDEGSRPAGSILFEFEVPILSFGFDLIDVEGPEEFGEDSGFVAVFYGEGDVELGRVGFGEFVDAGSPFFVAGAAFGNNTANRIPQITAEALALEQFKTVEINMGGSGAVDNITFEPIPEPSTFVLFGAGLALTALASRRAR